MSCSIKLVFWESRLFGEIDSDNKHATTMIIVVGVPSDDPSGTKGVSRAVAIDVSCVLELEFVLHIPAYIEEYFIFFSP
jgi:hypothetical protein